MLIFVVMLAGFFAALLASIMFSGAEIAIGFISRDSLEKLAENNIRGASVVLGILSNKRRFHLMLKTGKIISIVVGTILLYAYFLRYYGQLGLGILEIGFAACCVAITAYILMDVLVARLVAMGDYEKTVSRLAYFLLVFHVILFPLSYSLERLLSILIKRNIELAVKEEALIEFVKSESEDGVIEQEEKEMIESILEFSDTTVREVMVPRIDMVAAKKDISMDELIAIFEEEGHSRIPLYDGRVDNIVGVIYAKDLLTAIAKKGKENCVVTEIMRNAYFVPETKKISVLLKEFKIAKVHIAIVVDEYGGTAGIVAMEDLLEEIVGEINDEYDEEEQSALWLSEQTVLMDAGLDVDDVNEMINTSIPNEDFDTLGGFLYNQLGFIPQGGEIVEWENVTFTIREIHGNRISKVLVKLNEPSDTDTEHGK
ncbi:hemolysin family protein [bacterium]|nr:hemolysin family protein [bacterium]